MDNRIERNLIKDLYTTKFKQLRTMYDNKGYNGAIYVNKNNISFFYDIHKFLWFKSYTLKDSYRRIYSDNKVSKYDNNPLFEVSIYNPRVVSEQYINTINNEYLDLARMLVKEIIDIVKTKYNIEISFSEMVDIFDVKVLFTSKDE